MLYDIYPIEMAAEIRLDELRRKAANRRLIDEQSRQRRQMRARQLIARLHRSLDALEALLDRPLDERAPIKTPQQATR